VYVPHDKSDFSAMMSAGSFGSGDGVEVAFMVPGGTLWGGEVPVQAVDQVSGEVRSIEPLSAVILNTAGYVTPTSFYVEDADFDEVKDVLVTFDQAALDQLHAISDELDGAPVLALEIGEEKFTILEMTEVQQTELDLAGMIGDLRVRDQSGEVEVVVNDPTQTEKVGVPRAAGIVGVAPNPFNPKTTISFYVAEAGPVDVAVYDISGRMVARLVDSSVAAGEHSVEWTGVDTRGSRVASGVYFFRMRTGSVVDVKRGVLVK
jgi:hypothetical protein